MKMVKKIRAILGQEFEMNDVNRLSFIFAVYYRPAFFYSQYFIETYE